MHIDVLVPFFNVFRDEDLPLWLSIAIIGIGLLFFIWYYLHVYTPVSRALHKSVKDLNKIAGKSQFYAKFEHVDEIFNKPKLKQNWDGFKETFIFPGKFDEEKVIRNTIRPFKYFNFENLSQQYNISFYQAFPNIIVGVGLLLTFCGLVSAIYLTGQSIVAVHADPIASHSGNLKSALDSLLRIAAFKFLTSIAGLITSIVLTIEIRLCNGKLRNEYGRLNAILERNLQYESQEHLICTQQTIALRQLDYLRRQAEQFQSFTTTFAQETAQKTALAINSVVKLHAEKLYARIDPAITLMGEVIGKAADQAMTQLVRDFSAALRFEASQDMENLVNALMESQQALAEVSQRVRESGESIALLLTQVGGEQRTAFTTLLDEILDGVSARFSAVEKGLGTARSEIEGAAASFTAALAESTKLLESAAKQFGQTVEQGGERLSAQVATSAETLASASAKSSALMQDVASSVADKLSHLEDVMAERRERSQQAWENHLAEIGRRAEENNQLVQQTLTSIAETCTQSLAKSLATLTENLDQTLVRFAERLRTLAANYDDRAAKSAALFSQTTKEMSAHCTDALDHAGKQLESVDETFRAHAASAKTLLTAHVDELRAVLTKEVQESLALVHEQLAAAAEDLRKECKASQDQMTSLHDRLSESIAFTADALKETSAQLLTHSAQGADVLQHSLTRSAENMQTAFQTCIAETQDAFAALATTLQQTAQETARSCERVAASEERIAAQLERSERKFAPHTRAPRRA